MPKELHRKLAKTAKARGYSKERTGAYVYGTLHKAEKKLHRKKK